MSLSDAIRAVMGKPPLAAAEDKPSEDKAKKAVDPAVDEAEDDEDLAEKDKDAPAAEYEDDEEDADASEEDKTAPAARRAERARIAAILTHPAAAANPALAAHYAFKTGASVATASAALKAAAGTAPSRADQTRRRILGQAPRLGPDAPKASADTPSIVALAQARKGRGIIVG